MEASKLNRIYDSSFGLIVKEINNSYGFAKDSPVCISHVIAVWCFLSDNSLLTDSDIGRLLDMDERIVYVITRELLTKKLTEKVIIQ